MTTRPRAPDRRLSTEDWTQAALAAIAEGGLNAVAVEPLAISLGVTKGSFYAHFHNRNELVDAALQSWEKLHAAEVLTQIAAIDNPEQRLRILLVAALEFTQSLEPSVHVSLLGELHDKRVRESVHRVTQARMAVIARAYRDLGLTLKRAEYRARIGYAAYIGMLLLAREDPDRPMGDRQLAALLREAEERMIGDVGHR